ncbi:hypothetical protein CIPAW_16G114200 [Carya illinoinensis]|uniref:Uncharacterized protein n=2 Tax=Carya illinoinensis TaxID=32201 RepID=A0A8T1N9F5_CARIL|nr:hypothetical protein CIPAW_16G114200 [Carya illinoinensis]
MHLAETDHGLNMARAQSSEGLLYIKTTFSQIMHKGPGTMEARVLLTFSCDRSIRICKFRYCNWKSSQSFVFTRGWNRGENSDSYNWLSRLIEHFVRMHESEPKLEVQNRPIFHHNIDEKKLEEERS